MVISGVLKNVKTVEIPRDDGTNRKIYQLAFDEDTLNSREFRSVFVTTLASAISKAIEDDNDIYMSVVVRSVLPKISKRGVTFINYYGDVNDWKII